MQQTIQQILIRYWGFDKFRPLQEDIILSVLSGKDTLALLPTGGGKSICFQVPALAREGICIVVSPLIALMKDQVEGLNKKGIKAIAIYSGMHIREIDIALENCIYGDTKFLYLSPERLKSELILERIKSMNVNLIAVDEAHCISQWGYDFRPPYLKIAEVRTLLPNVPVMALTATATADVVKDIQAKLLFKQENVFQKSFSRTNLTYTVLFEEDKLTRILLVAQKISGSGIIYVRNRKKTKEIALFLFKNNISADFYHAGLDIQTRDTKQDNWIKGVTRIIVCTNAFGMGIDKPDVRFVMHVDIPDSLEAYFQEAGRAGRDEKKSFALLLYNNSDIIDLKRNFEDSFPPIVFIRNVYQALGNYFKITIGAGEMQTFSFDINDFINVYNFKPIVAYKALQFLEKEGYILTSDNFNDSSKVYIPITKESLYKFQVSNSAYDPFIKTLLRAYSGIFTEFTKINERELAKKLNTTEEAIVKTLNILHKFEIIIYESVTNLPKITYLTARTNIENVVFSQENYEFLKHVAQKKLDSVITYVTSTNKCRNEMLLGYFGETNISRCGTCDYCRQRNKANLSKLDFDNLVSQIKPILLVKELTIEEIVKHVNGYHEDKIINVLIWLIDNNNIVQTKEQKLFWNKTHHHDDN
ncbi:MAG: ATP-dependent DNA helicase RecQ [Bacteroidota bacterium]